MIAAFLRALTGLGEPRVLRLLLAAAALALGVFAALWAAAAWLLTGTAVSQWAWLDAILDVLGGIATLLLTWLLFPFVLSAAIALLLEAVADAIEARDYPALGKAPGLAVHQAVLAALRFLLVALVVNAALLPALLLGPVYPVLYLLANGYLLGRSYFELVALRRLSPAAARDLRQQHRGAVVGAGVVTVLLLTVPLLNLIAPVIAVIAFVHLLQGWRPAGRG